jgi:hypothetical protein
VMSFPSLGTLEEQICDSLSCGAIYTIEIDWCNFTDSLLFFVISLFTVWFGLTYDL